MKLSKKYLSFIILIITLSTFLLFSSCTRNQIGNSKGNESDISKLISYCAKEKNGENRIYFNYPQFNEKMTNAEKLNGLILGFVESALQEMLYGEFKGNFKDFSENWEWNNDEYTLQAMDIGYRITRSDSDYFSVTFDGLYNCKTAAHSINYFNSLTIDLKKCELVTLSNLYRIDTDFVELIRNKFKEQIRVGLAEKTGVLIDEIPKSVEELLSLQDDNALLEALRQADRDREYDFHSFLTDTTLGVSIPLEHVMGDHFEIMVGYDELESFKN